MVTLHLDVLTLALSQALYTFPCTPSSAALTINQAMEPITCVVTMSYTPRITPYLPAGLTYSITSIGNQHTVTISGTPKEGLNPRLFYIGYNAWISTVEIAGKCLCSPYNYSIRSTHLLQLWFRFYDSLHRY